MNLLHLRYFVELAHTQHYTRAAERLCITQPSLSHAIAQMEGELGVPLFEKRGRNVALTHFGEQFLTCAQQKLDTLHSLNESLPDPQLSAAMTRMEKAGRSIVEVVEANPAKAKQVRRFANYYLPDAVNVLQQYAKLAKQGVRGENAAAIRAEVEHNAASIATAFENQLDALYAAESMDLSADLTVLQNMLKGQGL